MYRSRNFDRCDPNTPRTSKHHHGSSVFSTAARSPDSAWHEKPSGRTGYASPPCKKTWPCCNGTHDCIDCVWSQHAHTSAPPESDRSRPVCGPVSSTSHHPRAPNVIHLSLIHISEPTRRTPISYA